VPNKTRFVSFVAGKGASGSGRTSLVAILRLISIVL